MVEVKKEPRDEYSDLIKSKLLLDDEEEEEEVSGGGGGVEDEQCDGEEEEEEEEEVPTRPNSPVESGDGLSSEERRTLGELVQRAKVASKVVLATKNKQIEELKAEKLKMKLEIESITEKYIKYKNMAKQNAAAGQNTSKIKELENTNKDIKTKAELREKLLKEEREKNAKLSKERERERVKCEQLSKDRQSEIEKSEKLSEENERLQVRYIELEKKVKVLMTKLQESSSKPDNLEALQDFTLQNPKTDVVSEDIEKKQAGQEKSDQNNDKPVLRSRKLNAKESMKSPASKSDTNNLEDGGGGVEDDEQALMLKVIEVVMTHQDSDGINVAEPFYKLPTKKKLPDYYKVIEAPMDIARIKEKVEKAEYSNVGAFERDFIMVWENARKYNEEDSAIFQVEWKLYVFSLFLIIYLAAGQCDTTSSFH